MKKYIFLVGLALVSLASCDKSELPELGPTMKSNTSWNPIDYGCYHEWNLYLIDLQNGDTTFMNGATMALYDVWGNYQNGQYDWVGCSTDTAYVVPDANNNMFELYTTIEPVDIYGNGSGQNSVTH